VHSGTDRLANLRDSILFKYTDMSMCYEAGLHKIPSFTTVLELWSKTKCLRVEFDKPDVERGLPVRTTIQQRVQGSPMPQVTVRSRTYNEAYESDLRRLHQMTYDNMKNPRPGRFRDAWAEKLRDMIATVLADKEQSTPSTITIAWRCRLGVSFFLQSVQDSPWLSMYDL